MASEAFFGRLVGGVALSVTMACGAAFAQSAPTSSSASDDTFSLLSPKPLASVNPLLQPSRDYRGLDFADWLFYPTFSAGAIYNDNLFLTARNHVSAIGTRLHPALIAERDAGIHKTTIYGDADARLYPDLAAANAVDARAGFSHIWEAQRDLVIKLQGQYDHKTLLTNGGLVLTPTGASGTLVGLQSYNQYQTAASVQKSFDWLFVGLAGGVVKTTYDQLDTTGGKLSQNYRDSLVTTVSARGGYWISPAFYAYTEAVGNFRDYADASYNSQGYRVVGGLGSDRISLFRGEIYGGYQQQIYDKALKGSLASPVFGGKIYWYPTRDWTVRASLDETFTDSSTPTPTNPLGNPARRTSARLSLSYQLARDWSASWFGGFDHSVYLGSPRLDDSYMTGANLTYGIYRNLGVTLNYTFIRVNSNAALSSYSCNVISMGATYKY